MEDKQEGNSDTAHGQTAGAEMLGIIQTLCKKCVYNLILILNELV